MKFKLFALTLLASAILAACSGTSVEQGKAIKGKEISNIKELVSDYSTGNKKAQNASITSTQLIVTKNDGSKTEYNLPKKDFFVSIAPFVDKTHP